LLVGGTMLYFKALRDGLSELPAADAAVRAAIDDEARHRGWPALHAELARVDPESATRLEPGDAQRIQRALELFRVTGVPMSRQLGTRGGALPFALVPVALVPADRSELHRRIAGRFDAMLAAGLVEELEGLRARYPLHPGLPSMRCVGYRQAWDYLEGAYERDALRDRGIFATRQLAKRQLTWLRAWQGLHAFDCLDPQVAPKVLTALRRAVDA
jgi:tRNA dimethylallyltransferase